MATLAAAHEPADLYQLGFRLYEQFRPGADWRVGLGSEGRAGSEEGASLGANGLDRAPRAPITDNLGRAAARPFFVEAGTYFS